MHPEVNTFLIIRASLYHFPSWYAVLDPFKRGKDCRSKVVRRSSHHRLVVGRGDNASVAGPFITGWWFQVFFIFTPIWGNDPIWLIFFKWVETTNQIRNYSICKTACNKHHDKLQEMLLALYSGTSNWSSVNLRLVRRKSLKSWSSHVRQWISHTFSSIRVDGSFVLGKHVKCKTYEIISKQYKQYIKHYTTIYDSDLIMTSWQGCGLHAGYWVMSLAWIVVLITRFQWVLPLFPVSVLPVAMWDILFIRLLVSTFPSPFPSILLESLARPLDQTGICNHLAALHLRVTLPRHGISLDLQEKALVWN